MTTSIDRLKIMMLTYAGKTVIGASILATLAKGQTYSATYSPTNLPDTTEQGQSGTNQCNGTSSSDSKCQNLFVNSIDDFCLFAPDTTQPIGNAERETVAYCLKSTYGTRLIPQGSINAAHFVETPDFVQITGGGSLAGMNIAANDDGGELDPHGADGNGNPIGGLVFTSAFGNKTQQAHEWTQYIGSGYFCIRVCKDGPNAPALCNHIYDVMGCGFNMPGDYSEGFDSCSGDSGEPMGVYGSSTWYQGVDPTPSAHPLISTSKCVTTTAINAAVATGAISTSAESSATMTSRSSLTTAASASPVSTGSSASRTTGSSSSASAPAATSSTGAAVTGNSRSVTVVVGASLLTLLAFLVTV